MSNKLDIGNEMLQLDVKNRAFFDELTEDERKKFSTFLMMKYSANVEGSTEMQSWYLLASNERVNKYFFDLSKHPKLQWLLCTTTSPSLGRQRHYWLASKKSNGPKAKIIKFLTNFFPAMKNDEIQLLAELNDEQDIKQLAKSLGWSDSEIKKELG